MDDCQQKKINGECLKSAFCYFPLSSGKPFGALFYIHKIEQINLIEEIAAHSA